MKKLLILIFFILTLTLLAITTKNTSAQDINCEDTSSLNLDQISRCLDKLNEARSQSEKATKPLEDQTNGLKQRISFIENDLVIKEKNIEEGYKNLEIKQKILNQTIRDYYVKSYYNSPLNLLLSSSSVSEFTQILGYQKATADRDKTIITSLVVSISGLEERKKDLEAEKINLIAVKEKLDKVVAEAKAYQANLSSTISVLTTKQQEILSAKSGTFTTSVGDVPLADDPNASPNYNPGFSPAFAGFSFGAYTHRNGMSQYGAKAQADDGKSYQDIIQWYYGGGVRRDDGMSDTIDVDGYGNMSMQTYLYGIAEMPSTWNINALKAQAVAARTYGVRANKPICTSQSCQVFLKSKSDNPPAAWKQAVDETFKEIIDRDVSAQYSSTTGGYINTLGWDTKCKSRTCWTAEAWEKIAGSPWFYKGWYTENYSNSSGKCGRSSPWLNQEEMADILNAYLIKNKGGVDNGRITPVTTSCWGGNPYSMSEARDLANSVGGGAVSSISSTSVSYSESGSTANVTFNTNRGSIQIGGSEYKEIFNLRAPGYISLRSPLFNMEKK